MNESVLAFENDLFRFGLLPSFGVDSGAWQWLIKKRNCKDR
jgi:hypothetical protein